MCKILNTKAQYIDFELQVPHTGTFLVVLFCCMSSRSSESIYLEPDYYNFVLYCVITL